MKNCMPKTWLGLMVVLLVGGLLIAAVVLIGVDGSNHSLGSSLLVSAFAIFMLFGLYSTILKKFFHATPGILDDNNAHEVSEGSKMAEDSKTSTGSALGGNVYTGVCVHAR